MGRGGQDGCAEMIYLADGLAGWRGERLFSAAPRAVESPASGPLGGRAMSQRELGCCDGK